MRGFLRIASSRAPFRRAGLAWAVKGSAGAIDVDICDLDGERLSRLINEPVLTIKAGLEEGGFDSRTKFTGKFGPDACTTLIAVERHRREREFQSAQGAESGSEGGAPASVAPEAKDEEAGAASSADPEGTSPAAAAGDAESREGTDGAVAGQDSAPDGEKQPEEGPQPPVAASDISTEDTDGGKPAGSRRRKA